MGYGPRDESFIDLTDTSAPGFTEIVDIEEVGNQLKVTVRLPDADVSGPLTGLNTLGWATILSGDPDPFGDVSMEELLANSAYVSGTIDVSGQTPGVTYAFFIDKFANSGRQQVTAACAD